MVHSITLSFSKLLSLKIAMVAILCIAFLLWQSSLYHKTQSETTAQTLSEYAENIDRTLITALNNVRYEMSYITRQISQQTDNLEKTKHFLYTFEESSDKNLPTKSFAWIDNSGQIHTNATSPDFLPLFDTNLLDRAKEEPYKMIIGTSYIVKNKSMIPTIMGVIDISGNYAGALIGNIFIEDMLAPLDQDLSYIIIDEAFNHIFSSPIETSFTGILNDTIKYTIQSSIKQSDLLIAPSLFNRNTPYYFYYKSKQYPFTIVLSYGKEN